MNRQKISTKGLVIVGMAAAVLAILSQLSIPSPTGVPITLQTFAVALIGVVLYAKKGVATVAVYTLIGAVGMPVFANFNAGAAALVGKTGGFIWGFFILTLLCGIGSKMNSKWLGILIGALGLIPCHLLGVLQFSIISHMGIIESAVLVSLPYLIKDVISVILAYIVGEKVRGLLLRASILTF